MTVQNLDQGLMAKLAEGINNNYAAFRDSTREAIQSAVECGKLLEHAKARVEHGEWLDWLQANTNVSARWAQKLMRLARHADEILENTNSGAHFTINAALATITKRKNNPVGQAVPLLQRGGASKGDTQHSPCANGEALEALQSDLAEIHSRDKTGRILQAISMVFEIGITPNDAARVVIRTAVQANTPALRKNAATAADAAVAWLRDFIRELERPPPSRQTGVPHLVHDAVREVPDRGSETSD